MMAVLSWYIVVQALGVTAYVLTGPCFHRLPDSGYGVSKSLGVLTLGLLLWLGTALGLLRNEPGGALLVMGGLVATAAVVGPRRPLPDLRVLAASELIFAAAFGGWCLVRSLTPAVTHTEQPMDLMLLTAVSTNPTFPPADSWLAGYPVSYYYFGYWLMSALGFLTGQPPEVSYNVGQACWFALLALGCFSLGVNLTASTGGGRDCSWASIAAGAITAVVVAFSANLHVPLEWVAASATGPRSPLAETVWWWWPSSRVLQDITPTGQPIEIITEFPFFSYLLGDNHPHLLSMPFVVLSMACALGLLLQRSAPDAGSAAPLAPAGRPALRPNVSLGLSMVVVGALVGLNTWDLPAALCVLVLAASWPASGEHAVWRALGRAAWISIAAVTITLLVYFPYLVTAQSQVKGLLPNLWHPTPIGQFMTMFGTLLPGVVVLAGLAWREQRPRFGTLARAVAGTLVAGGAWLFASAVWAAQSDAGRAWMAGVAPGVERPLAMVLSRWVTGWPVLVLGAVAIGVLAALIRARLVRGHPGADVLTFALLLASVGLGLALAPELVYLHDAFANRMNTVFKFYYQAWLYLATAGTSGIVIAWRRGGAGRVGALAALMVVASGLIYPVAALRSAIQERPAGAPTLDALALLRQQVPDEWAAIDWVRENTPRRAVIAQAPGISYRADYSLLSTATGRPTLLGWQGHERQWRGDAFQTMAAGRLEALERIYNPPSPDALRDTLDAWHVDLVHVGPLERGRYAMTAGHEALIARVMVLVFEHGAVRLYRRRD